VDSAVKGEGKRGHFSYDLEGGEEMLAMPGGREGESFLPI